MEDTGWVTLAEPQRVTHPHPQRRKADWQKQKQTETNSGEHIFSNRQSQSEGTQNLEAQQQSLRELVGKAVGRQPFAGNSGKTHGHCGGGRSAGRERATGLQGASVI